MGMIQDIVFETSYRLQSDFELKKEKVHEDSRVERERYTNSHLNQQPDGLLINMCNELAACSCRKTYQQLKYI